MVAVILKVFPFAAMTVCAGTGADWLYFTCLWQFNFSVALFLKRLEVQQNQVSLGHAKNTRRKPSIVIKNKC